MDSPPDVIGPINLGDPEESTIKELADMALEVTGSSSALVHRDLSLDEGLRRTPTCFQELEVSPRT